jgi:hypothetical protein
LIEDDQGDDLSKCQPKNDPLRQLNFDPLVI